MTKLKLTAEQAFERAERECADGNRALGRAIYQQLLDTLPPSHALRIKAEAGLKAVQHHLLPGAQRQALIALHASGRLQDALREAEKLSAGFPADWFLPYFTGTLLSQLGGHEQALQFLETALERNTGNAEIYVAKGRALQKLGRVAEAITCYDRLLQMQPKNIKALSDKAVALDAFGRLEEALACCEQVIALDRNNAGALSNRSHILRKMDLYEEALASSETAIALQETNVSAHVNRGAALQELGRLEEALASYEHVLKLDGRHIKGLTGRAFVLRELGQFAKARAGYDQALKVNAANMDARIGRAFASFCLGDLAAGWADYQARAEAVVYAWYAPAVPEWQGQPLADKCLFVMPEQGIGDEVLWGNYLPFMYEQAKQLVIACDHRLVEAYRRRFPKACVLERKTDSRLDNEALYEAAPKADYRALVGSLPAYAWRTPKDIKPHPDGFLTPDPARKKKMKQWLRSISGKPKVALAWRSGRLSRTRQKNYCTIDQLAPLFELKDSVDFINIQYGDITDELEQAGEQFGVSIHRPPGVDLKDDIEANLALISACDLTVSVATAPAQFALAVGAPVLIMGLGEAWWQFGREDKKAAFAKDGEFVFQGFLQGWTGLVSSVAQRVKVRLNL